MRQGVLVKKVRYTSCRGPQNVVQFLDLYTINRFEDGREKWQTQTHDCGIFQATPLTGYVGSVDSSLNSW